ncbi:hypothetical protein LPMP_355770 [Leishmania panamensis]|uniref:SWIM-type domain-containing protein n=1 Tax=Leishmania panamensis TaxID=5679 RepID=A0A088SLM6_LEIPA|nr:hypothetical protein LPMP_355770 [Leishmania panamensis]AIO02707.1 hypothetical protein LPMP_355770 [Leishmania panamensis]
MDTSEEGHWRVVENFPVPITRAVLDAYAQYVIASSNASDTVRPDGAEAHSVPKSVEEALAPLEILYGKTALSAIGIALHGAESIVRYVESAEVSSSDDEEAGKTSDDEEDSTHYDTHRARRGGGGAMSSTVSVHGISQPNDHASAPGVSSPLAEQRGRCLYHVGEHTLFSPYYCPCSAYAYQSIQRQEVWCCKHMLALQLVLRIEATGVTQGNLLVRIVSSAEYEQLLLHSLGIT